jgi:hypothetical protein
MKVIETDYLIIGSGAVGMAFADTLIEETDAHLTIVDRHAQPGGHWNDAYAFVALHQPSCFYGVNSAALGSSRRDVAGINKGLYELATGSQISAYYETLMRRRLLPTGRVSYHPMTEYAGDGRFVSLLSGSETKVHVRRKTVDATYGSPTVPATHQRRFEVADGVRILPPNDLPRLWMQERRPTRLVVIGAGKTAMDVVTWLLNVGAEPDSIQWIKPRDSWLLNRICFQPGVEFFDTVFGAQAAQMKAFAEATSVADIFDRLEAAGVVMRVDQDVTPTMFHYATISSHEVYELRRIRDVIRKGRVRSICGDRIELDDGDERGEEDALYIDCTASAVEPRSLRPIFQGDLIVPQLVRAAQATFSAALIAYIEAHYQDDRAKNRLCQPVPFPASLAEYPSTNIVNMLNQYHWSHDKSLIEWINKSRLDGFGEMIAASHEDSSRVALINALHEHWKPALQNLKRLSGGD